MSRTSSLNHRLSFISICLEGILVLKLQERETHLNNTTITNVKEAIDFTIAVTNVGDVYRKLAKYMFSFNPTLSVFRRKKCQLVKC